MAGALQQPVREPVTPRVLEKSVWAGANLTSFGFASDALKELADIALSAKQIRRMTTQVGGDRVAERRRMVEAFAAKPLMQRTTPKPGVTPPEVGVVMIDNGTHQRRDQFQNPAADTHWKQETGGLVLSMSSAEHDADPCPDLPGWLVQSAVVAEIAGLAKPEEQPEETNEDNAETSALSASSSESSESLDASDRGFSWTPQVVSREVIATTDTAAAGRHLEWLAWETGVTAAERQALVGDGARSIWNIHKKHFSRMTGILDLMHGLSYAYRAAAVRDDPGLYRHWATAIWQGRVGDVIDELEQIQTEVGPPPKDATADDPRQRIDRALTYYRFHRSRMNYPAYRKRGLPITSSLMESAIKQINQRIKGTEKFWNRETAEGVLKLRADSLSDSRPLDKFWTRWRKNQSGTNRYRNAA